MRQAYDYWQDQPDNYLPAASLQKLRPQVNCRQNQQIQATTIAQRRTKDAFCVKTTVKAHSYQRKAERINKYPINTPFKIVPIRTVVIKFRIRPLQTPSQPGFKWHKEVQKSKGSSLPRLGGLFSQTDSIGTEHNEHRTETKAIKLDVTNSNSALEGCSTGWVSTQRLPYEMACTPRRLPTRLVSLLSLLIENRCKSSPFTQAMHIMAAQAHSFL